MKYFFNHKMYVQASFEFLQCPLLSVHIMSMEVGTDTTCITGGLHLQTKALRCILIKLLMRHELMGGQKSSQIKRNYSFKIGFLSLIHI